ncbi:MAG: NAD-dependent epimerase/dehydratase family protein [Devosia sp.]|uniref:NAD-dependent epimerase/dehydratase family protein n=1 Tax=Devosia sp. TaxID=1871048 RepID=UPI002618C19B|nr:NAD-dependent epimerase/dehydratase family protein [Devosia sp.]MDB5528506.1 NAD-dependent epimerase/dehydratase family protein [Devosia sp.]
MNIFVTGTAGFIGFHLARRLLADGHSVTGYDGMTPFYDDGLKAGRMALLSNQAGFHGVRGMLEDAAGLTEALRASQAEIVVHLAAQAGVRYSIEAPETYISSNLVGTANLLEAVRAHRPRHLVFASTSSVYGGNLKMPFAETDHSNNPVSLYAATKKGGEAMVHAYAHLWGIPATSMRFFTVYGPWGRPDMAALKFVRAIEAGEAIEVYGEGRMRRDFTYVDDLVEAIARIIDRPPVAGEALEGDTLSPVAPSRIVNLGGGQPRELMDFIAAIEAALGKKARLDFLPMQQGDVVETYSDVSLLRQLIGAVPQTSIEEGAARLVEWYRQFYR